MAQEWHQDVTDRASVPWLLRHVGKVHRQASRVRMSLDPGKEPGQPIILMVLQKAKASGTAVSQNDLAQVLHVSDPTITASLKSLERQGYISREPDPGDMRRKLPILTPQGEEVAKECRKSVEYTNDAMLEGFTEEEKKTLEMLLQRIDSNLQRIIDETKSV